VPVALTLQSAFSFLSGACSPERLVERAANLGYDSLAIADTADIGAMPRLAVEAARHGVHPILGAELRVRGLPVTLLARTRTGAQNLAALVTRARVGDLSIWQKTDATRGRGRPDIPWEQLAHRSEGLHLLTGPASGPLGSLILQGQRDAARALLWQYKATFGDRVAVEVQLHHAGGTEAALAAQLIELAELTNTSWVVSQSARYVDDDSRLVHDILTALRCGVDLDTALGTGALLPNDQWCLRTPEELAVMWRGREEGLREAERIASECGFELTWLRPPLPAFPVPQARDPDEYLRERVADGARERWGVPLTQKQSDQLDHELTVIRRLGFAGFFLVMWDACNFARRQGILCQGRGSAANSAVAYCLGVTAVDPVENGLLFERFLSEVRVDTGSGKREATEAPDIDVDIEHDRREQVLDYVYSKYAREHSGITCTVQTYRGPNAILDSMRALGYPAELARNISKRAHYHEPSTAADYIEEMLGGRFGLELDTARGRTLLRAIRAFENVPRMRSTHVGGFVLSAAPLGEYVPIEATTMGRTIIQFDKDDLDIIGIPKFDFLGLGALSMVRRAFDAIEVREGKRPQLYGLDYRDKPTYDLISDGETIGTFQIESRAQISSILHTRPEHLYDIVVQIALVRPGPIQADFVHPYTRRRRGLEDVTYLHPAMEPILKRTYGIPIFQEQAMALAMALGGYTAGQADALRRAMGNIRKKTRLMGELERLKEAMVKYDIDPPVTPELAEKIAHDLESFANYGFPESHAWSFGLIAFATAYLKKHYPSEFFMGLLNSWPMGFYPPGTLLHDARRHGVTVLGPCMRDGDWECTVEPCDASPHPALRVGWRHVTGLGTKSLDRLRAARDEVGRFSSIEDVVRRAKLERAEAVGLARAGAFGAWESDRRRAAWMALRAVGDTLVLAPARETPYFPRAMTRDELIFLDYAAFGGSPLGHPMEHMRERLRSEGVLGSKELRQLQGKERIKVAGLVTVRQRPESANGTIFLLLEDEHGFINVIVPAKLVDPNVEVVKHAGFILVEGKFEKDGEVRNVVGAGFKELQVGELAHYSHDFH
jgi:error-prone DNA polymerase